MTDQPAPPADADPLSRIDQLVAAGFAVAVLALLALGAILSNLPH